MKKILIALFICLAFSFCLSLNTLDAETNTNILKKELSVLNLANPEEDLNNQISSKNYKFIGVYEFARDFPGIERTNYMLVEKHGARMLKGTSDAIESKEHDELIQQAKKYAKTYNIALLKYITQNKDIEIIATKEHSHPFVTMLEEIELKNFINKQHWRKGDFPTFNFIQCDIDKDRARLSYKKENSNLEFYLAYFQKVGGMWYFDFNDMILLPKIQNDGLETTLIDALKKRNKMYWFESDNL